MADKKSKSKPSKVAKQAEPASTPRVERGPHTLPNDDIDTKGKSQTLPAGGSVMFRCLEVKGMGKKSHDDLHYSFKIDGEDKYHTKQPAKADKFDGETFQEFGVKSEAKIVSIELNNKGLLTTSFIGEVRFDVESLRDGYPNDKWYQLTTKAGKEGKKQPKGQVHIQILYLAPQTKPRHDEFKTPLISLVAMNRLDLFVRKIDDLGGKGNVSDKSNEKDAVTPLIYAAAEGKPGFVKLLMEYGASLSETNKDGQTAIHLAAKNSHHVVLRYLLKQKGAPINSQDTTALRNTALHLASSENAGESVAILIQAGADTSVTNAKGDAPLHYALCQAAGAAKSVWELVKGGADVYAKGGEDLPAWEVAQRKDLCSSSQTRNQFMKACDVLDPREFPLQQKYPVKQRVEGDGFTSDWTTATQFIVKSKQTTDVTFLLYPVARTDEWQKQIGFCVIKDDEPHHTLPSFQPEGIGFGGSESFTCVVEPEHTYTVVSFALDKELEGKFGVCFFQRKGREELKIVAAQKWSHTTSLSSAWKGDNAAGSSMPSAWKNTRYVVTCDSDKEQDCYVMLGQKSKDVSAIVFDNNRIVPAKFYIGLFVYTTDRKTETAKSSKWHNSKEVYLKFRIGGAHKSLLIVPCTVMPGEELEYELSVFCDSKVSLKKEK